MKMMVEIDTELANKEAYNNFSKPDEPSDIQGGDHVVHIEDEDENFR